MPVTPFIPLIAKGASVVGGLLGGKLAQNAAQQRSPEEQAALTGASGAASNLQTTGQGLIGQGLPGVQQSMGYYSSLLNGNRSQMGLATAAPRAAITDQTRGAEQGLERSGLRGGIRDLAKANLQRQSAGQIAGLTTGVQPDAARALGALGSETVGQGGNMLGQSGSIYSKLLGEGFDNRKYARKEGQDAGSSIGSLLFDVLNGKYKKPGSGSNPGVINDDWKGFGSGSGGTGLPAGGFSGWGA